MLRDCLAKFSISNYFTFDMSVPQMLSYRDAGLSFFTGQSDIQPSPVLYDEAAGIWADCFTSTDWITSSIISGHIRNGKRICFVSPELHGRNDYYAFWEKLKGWDDDEALMLCTDFPDEAYEFFTGRRRNDAD